MGAVAVVGRTVQSLRRRRRPLRRGITPRYIEGGPGRGASEAVEMRTMVLEGSCVPLHLSLPFPSIGSRFLLRGYHALPSSFGKVFNVEKRWKIIREMGSGAYGFVVFVQPVSVILTSEADPGLLYSCSWFIQVSCRRDYRGGRGHQARDAGDGASAAIETGVERDHAPSTFRSPRKHHGSY